MAEHLGVVPYLNLSSMPSMPAAPCGERGERQHRGLSRLSRRRMPSPAAHSDSEDSWAAKFSPGLRAELLGGIGDGDANVHRPHTSTPLSPAHTDAGGSDYSLPPGADPRQHCRACFYCELPPSRCHPSCGMRLCLVCREEDHVHSPEGKCTCGHHLCA